MKYITDCKKCGNELPNPIPDNIIGNLIFICYDCKEKLEAEERKRRLYNPPDMEIPYKP